MATTPRPTSPRQPQRRRSAWLAWSVCGLSVALVLSLVAWADSFSWAETPLHDSGIWVTNGRQSQYGRVNKAAGAIDGVLLLPGDSGPTGSRIDVLQDGATVVVRDLTGGRLLPVDAAAGANLMTSQVALPPTTVVDLAGGVLAAVDSRTGEVRLTTYDPDRPLDLTPLDPTSPARLTTPLSGVSDARVDLAVGLDGVVHVVSSAGLDLVLEPDDSEAVERQFAGAGELTAVAVTLVGDQPVVADPDSGRLWLPGGQVVETPNGVGLKLQRPSGPADAVWLATVAGLVRVGLYDGRVEESPAPLSGATTAAAVAEPVVVADCALGAWAGSPGAVLRVCPGQSAQSIGIDRQGELLEPVFRVNRSLVVLNDVETGRVFDLERGASLDFWSELQPPDDVADQLEESRRRSDVTDPEAVDDLIGARPGRVTVAHVLDNDSDAAGQVLVVSGLDRGSTPDQVGLTIAPDGQTIHIDLPDPAPLGSFSFGYEVFNGVGRGGAQVTVEARGPDLNSVPQLRPGATTPVFPVASFGSLALPVLGDWRDPDGDAVSLTRATWAGGPLPVTGDGQIRFVADRHDSTEQVEVTYWVSDGRTESEAKAIVHLLGVGESHGVAPVGFPDVVRAQVSAPVKVFPLSNDMVGADPAQPGARLALQGSVLTPDGVEARTDLASGLVELTAQRPGSYQLDYTVGFGSAPFGHSVIRLDVSDDESLGLTAVPDQVAVRGQVPVTVDVLANDWDPRGSVLTVVRVEVDRADQLRVAVVDGRWVRVMPLVAELAPNPAQVRYVVTDGQGQTASGLIQLTQLPAVADGGDVAVVNDDWARVRVGDQVLVPVLGNDASVSGLPLVIDDRYVGVAAGELSVVDPSGVVGRDVGRAFV
ncbi:MAG: hypothetical protein LBJ44_02315, partial [Propionibacteriaceae bacterium]|nr:hypothetical protein [Propionibacteriaceae bacterium]